jgi:hypothetical protein
MADLDPTELTRIRHAHSMLIDRRESLGVRRHIAAR